LLPQQFVYKILKKMERAGYVQITRGTDGGCRLIADLSTKSLYDLIEVMEAEKRISSCMQPGFVCEWRQSHGSRCTVHNRLIDIQNVLDTELRKHSLHQMLFEED
jgi:DNA-binding IscR family transcriptional regulator